MKISVLDAKHNTIVGDVQVAAFQAFKDAAERFSKQTSLVRYNAAALMLDQGAYLMFLSGKHAAPQLATFLRRIADCLDAESSGNMDRAQAARATAMLAYFKALLPDAEFETRTDA